MIPWTSKILQNHSGKIGDFSLAFGQPLPLRIPLFRNQRMMVTSVSLVLETHIPCYCEADQKKRSPSTLELLIVTKSLRIKIRRSFRFKIIYSMADLELQEKEVTQWITRWWFQTFLFSPRSLEKWFYLTIFQLGFSSTKKIRLTHRCDLPLPGKPNTLTTANIYSSMDGTFDDFQRKMWHS